MKHRLVTKQVSSPEEIRACYDSRGDIYEEGHGNPDKLLGYRLDLFRKLLAFQPADHVLDIGCGEGHHLRGLAGDFSKGTGIDFSGTMIDLANRRNDAPNLTFHQDDATKLATIADTSYDVVMCSGALEHMVDQAAVFQSLFRVLKPGGRLGILTPNGRYTWYRTIAPRLGISTQFYSSDKFMTQQELSAFMTEAGFRNIRIRPWTFVPKYGMPGWTATLLDGLDAAGKLFRIHRWRGGLQLFAQKPE